MSLDIPILMIVEVVLQCFNGTSKHPKYYWCNIAQQFDLSADGFILSYYKYNWFNYIMFLYNTKYNRPVNNNSKANKQELNMYGIIYNEIYLIFLNKQLITRDPLLKKYKQVYISQSLYL